MDKTENPHWSESSGSFFSLSGSLLTKIFAFRSLKRMQWETSKIQQLCWHKYKRHQTNCRFKRSVIADGNDINVHLEELFWQSEMSHFIILLDTQNFSCKITTRLPQAQPNTQCFWKSTCLGIYIKAHEMSFQILHGNVGSNLQVLHPAFDWCGLWLQSIDPYGTFRMSSHYHPNCVAICRMIFKSPFFEKMPLRLLSDYINCEYKRLLAHPCYVDLTRRPSVLVGFPCYPASKPDSDSEPMND